MFLSSLRGYGDYALLFLRLVIGVIFLYHGLQKWGMSDPNTIFTILKFAEPLGGAALILGALTQLASLGLSIIMVGAIYMKATGFGSSAPNFPGTFVGAQGAGWEFDLMILAGCVVLLIMGAGSMSVDRQVLKQ